MADEGEDASLVKAKAQLATLLAANPASEVALVPTESGPVLRLRKPWGDNSITFNLADCGKLIDSLNAVILPPRLSAVWHRDNSALEVIWTAYDLSKSQQEIEGRSFVFDYCGSQHKCEFKDSSEQLLEIARYAIPVGMMSTNHRNLYSFAMHMQAIDDTRESVKTKPRSFWISDVDPAEENMIPLLSNLNFYLTYYDALSPYVVIHPQAAEKIVSQKTRYLIGQFPSTINSRKLDENLLSFWESAQSGSAFMKFLLYFRIIKYAAYHYIDDTARAGIKKILMKPELLSDVPGAIDGVVSALSATQKLHDSQRIRMTIKHCVSPQVLWPDVRDNLDFFSKPTHFDGGFSVE